MNVEMHTLPDGAPAAQLARKEWSPAAKLNEFLSRPARKKAFEGRRARTLNPVNKSVAALQTVLRDGVHSALLGREDLRWLTHGTDCVFGTKRVRHEQGYGGIYETFAKGKQFDVQRMGVVGCAAAAGVVVAVAPAYIVGAAVGIVGHMVTRIVKPHEWNEENTLGTTMHRYGKVVAVAPACLAIPLAEGVTVVV